MAKDAKPKITLTLPYPPTINHYYIKGRILTNNARQYRSDVSLEALSQSTAPALKGNLSMSLLLHPPDRRRRDLDNVLKALKDAMQHAGVYRDDNQIKEYRSIRWGDPVSGGRVVVTLEEI